MLDRGRSDDSTRPVAIHRRARPLALRAPALALFTLCATGCVELFQEPTPRPMVEAPMADGGGAATPDEGEPDALVFDRDPLCEPTDETCDGRDEDCDGRVDEGISPPSCGDSGVCAGTRATCEGVEGWVCADLEDLPQYEAAESRCDGIDNDCDGRVDEAQGAGEPCSDGLGVCLREGTVVCDGLDAARCTATASAPGEEMCNGADDDCDGAVDEGTGDAIDPRVGAPCLVSRAGCALRGQVVCLPSGDAITCRPPDAPPEAEACDGLDNDCDGRVDEGCQTAEVAVGDRHACTRSEDGAVHCWGSDLRGNLSEKPDASYLAIGAGDDETCGIRADDGQVAAGRIECWGGVDHQMDAQFTQLSVGLNGAVCGVVGGTLAEPLGTLRCAAFDRPPGGDAHVDVSVGEDHACAIARRDDGRAGQAVCWGSDEQHGQQAAPGDDFTAIAAGRDHTCGLRPDGGVRCWGFPSRTHAPEDVDFGALPSEMGYIHSCGLAPDGRAVCWAGGTSPIAYTPPDAPFTQLSVGRSRSCGVRTDGIVDCWGTGASGVLETPSGAFEALATGQPAPYICGRRRGGGVECWGQLVYEQQPVGDARAIGVADTMTCALDAAGAPSCAGYETVGLELPPGPFASVTCGRAQCCALGVAGPGAEGADAHCWTLLDLGGPGQGWADYAVPGPFDALQMGFGDACGRRPDGSLYCWGVRGAAEDPPAEVGLPRAIERVIDFDVALSFGCALVAGGEPAPDGMPTGQVACWGDDTIYGRLPTAPMTRLSCGYGTCCGLTVDHQLQCWGRASHDEDLPPEGPFTDVEMGTGFGCALDADGEVSCWGGIH